MMHAQYIAVKVVMALLLMLCAWRIGRYAGETDAADIRARLVLGDDRHLEHGRRWLVRAGLMVVPLVLCTAVFGWTLTNACYLCGVVYGVLAPTHRFTLNAARPMPRYYINGRGGSIYDKVWEAVAWVLCLVLRKVKFLPGKSATAFEVGILCVSLFKLFHHG